MSASSPLLSNSDSNSSRKPATTNNKAAAPSAQAKGFLTLLGVSRIAFGLGCLLAPSLTLGILGVSTLSPEAALVARMFGGREIVIGEGLLLAERSAESARRVAADTKAQFAAGEEVRRAVWLNVATDSMDALAIIAAFLHGSLVDGVVLAKLFGGALFMLSTGLETAWLYP